jgi:hypothetical protein
VPPVRLPFQLMLFAALAAVGAGPADAQQRPDFGVLSIQVRPPNAEILVDDTRWTAPEGPAPLQIQLTVGVHQVEVRSPGRQAFVRQVTIRTGETTTLNVSLTEAEPPGAPPAPPAPPRPRPPGAPAAPHQSVRVAPGEDGYVFAPDVRITEIHDRTSTLMGAYGGYVFGGTVLIGAGGYWQVSGTEPTYMSYFGGVVEYRLLTTGTVGFNLHALVGGGWQYADTGYYWYRTNGRYGHKAYAYYDEGFFVAEPEAQVVIRFSPSIRLQGGIGYRATSAHGLDGVSGSISLQIGR